MTLLVTLLWCQVPCRAAVISIKKPLLDCVSPIPSRIGECVPRKPSCGIMSVAHLLFWSSEVLLRVDCTKRTVTFVSECVPVNDWSKIQNQSLGIGFVGNRPHPQADGSCGMNPNNPHYWFQWTSILQRGMPTNLASSLFPRFPSRAAISTRLIHDMQFFQ